MTTRPALTDLAVLRAAAADFQGALHLSLDDDDTTTWFLDAIKSGGFSAYETGKRLEEHGWPVDDEFLQALDDYFSHTHTAHREAVANWVARNAIVAHHTEGDFVRWTDRRGTHEGVVAGIDRKHATYTVRVPALGHVAEGVGTHGVVLAFETFHDIVAAPEAFALMPPPGPSRPTQHAPHPDDHKRFNRASGVRVEGATHP